MLAHAETWLVRHRLGWIHASTPIREAIREARGARRTWRKIPRAHRREILRLIVKVHAENLAEWRRWR